MKYLGKFVIRVKSLNEKLANSTNPDGKHTMEVLTASADATPVPFLATSMSSSALTEGGYKVGEEVVATLEEGKSDDGNPLYKWTLVSRGPRIVEEFQFRNMDNQVKVEESDPTLAADAKTSGRVQKAERKVVTLAEKIATLAKLKGDGQAVKEYLGTITVKN